MYLTLELYKNWIIKMNENPPNIQSGNGGTKAVFRFGVEIL